MTGAERPVLKNKFIHFLLLPLALVFISGARADENDQQWSVNLDVLGLGAFAPNGGPALDGGLGAAAFGDWRPVPFLSLGTGLDFTGYPGGGWVSSSWSLGGRLFPLPMEKGGEWYLQGTAGLNLATYTLKSRWPGSFHGTFGAGYRLFQGPSNALDLGAQYDFFSPVHEPLQALGIKLGWTWLFGKVPTPPPTVWTPALNGPATVESAPASSMPPTVQKEKTEGQGAPLPAPVPTATSGGGN